MKPVPTVTAAGGSGYKIWEIGKRAKNKIMTIILINTTQNLIFISYPHRKGNSRWTTSFPQLCRMQIFKN